LLRGKADNAMRLGLCSRSKDVIEPMLKPQVRFAGLRRIVCVRC
jgi:valyl-tRNA synthetase